MEIKARIPGMITAINVKVGDEVKVKTVVGVMEAMKMEQPIASPAEGTVKEIKANINNRS
jgi:biotin carboxyl carrier protein